MTKQQKSKPVPALDVAYYFLKLAKESERPVTNKVLQKLLYYAQVWHYTIFDEKLFVEKIEAWVHGPAIPKIYGKFKSFQFNPIDLDISSIPLRLTKTQAKFLQNIWDIYGKLDGASLEALTHSELPWQEAREGLSSGESSNNSIDLKTAKEFYGARLESIRS